MLCCPLLGCLRLLPHRVVATLQPVPTALGFPQCPAEASQNATLRLWMAAQTTFLGAIGHHLMLSLELLGTAVTKSSGLHSRTAMPPVLRHTRGKGTAQSAVVLVGGPRCVVVAALHLKWHCSGCMALPYIRVESDFVLCWTLGTLEVPEWPAPQ
jgi:hypothetical protein